MLSPTFRLGLFPLPLNYSDWEPRAFVTKKVKKKKKNLAKLYGVFKRTRVGVSGNAEHCESF